MSIGLFPSFMTIHQVIQGGITEMYYNTILIIVQLLKIFVDCEGHDKNDG
jgi:hypothetical protein